MHRIGQAPNPDCPHDNSAERTTEHVLLDYATLQVRRDLHHLHALEHLWERPEGIAIPQGRLHHLEAHTMHTKIVVVGRGECSRGRGTMAYATLTPLPPPAEGPGGGVRRGVRVAAAAPH